MINPVINDLCSCYTGKIFPLIWGMLEHHLKGKRTSGYILPTIKGETNTWYDLQILKTGYHTWEYWCGLCIGWLRKQSACDTKFFQGAYMTWQIQPSLLGMNTVWSLWQTLTKSEHKSLRLGKKGILPATQNFTVLKAMPDVLLDPGKTGSMIIGHQVIMQNREGYCCQPHQVT